jgi:selenocysteine-specific elongation factor
MHHHDQPASELHRGQRAAINLAGVRHDEVVRGFELAAPGHLLPAHCVTAQFELLKSAPRAIKHRARVRFHVGTSETFAALIVLDEPKELHPGERRVVQILLRDPITVVWHQPFVVRAESPIVTVGGGRILVPVTQRRRRWDEPTRTALTQLQQNDPLVRAAAATLLMGLAAWQPADLVRMAGIQDVENVTAELLRRGICYQLTLSAQRQPILHRDVLATCTERIRHTLEGLHDADPLRLEIDRSLLSGQFPQLARDGLLAAILDQMHQRQIVRMTSTGIAIHSKELKLSTQQQELRERILNQLQAAGFQPPTVTEFAAAERVSAAEARKLFQLAAATGQLIHIGGEMYLHRDVELEMRRRLRPQLQQAGLTLSQIRELLGTTRKYAVPYCEYLDRVGFTRRQGDLRVLAPQAMTP